MLYLIKFIKYMSLTNNLKEKNKKEIFRYNINISNIKLCYILKPSQYNFFLIKYLTNNILMYFNNYFQRNFNIIGELLKV